MNLQDTDHLPAKAFNYTDKFYTLGFEPWKESSLENALNQKQSNKSTLYPEFHLTSPSTHILTASTNPQHLEEEEEVSEQLHP